MLEVQDSGNLLTFDVTCIHWYPLVSTSIKAAFGICRAVTTQRLRMSEERNLVWEMTEVAASLERIETRFNKSPIAEQAPLGLRCFPSECASTKIEVRPAQNLQDFQG